MSWRLPYRAALPLLVCFGCSDSPKATTPSADAAAPAVGSADAGADVGQEPSTDASTRDSSGGNDASTDAPVDVSPQLPVGETCENAELVAPIRNGAALSLTSQSNNGYANDYEGTLDGRCIYAPGRDRVYAVVVPAGATLDVTLRPTQGFEAALNIVVGKENCSSTTFNCEVGSDDGDGTEQEIAGYTNISSEDRTAFVIVDSPLPGEAGLFGLQLRLRDELPGETCRSAVPVTPGVLANETLVGYANDYGDTALGGTQWPTCAESASADKVYQVDVGPGQSLRTSVLPAPGFDPVVSLIVGAASRCDEQSRSCAGWVDVDNQPTAMSNVPDVICYTNPTALPQSVFVLVDASEIAVGAYSLTTELLNGACP
jgi:hypothetical protein